MCLLCGRLWPAVLVVGAVGGVAAQGPGGRFVDGVRIVDNIARRSAPIAFTIAAKPTLDLGGLKASPDDEFSPNGGYLNGVRLSDGRWAVIDESRIRFFNPAGKQLAVVGRKGGGPGEFQQITGICRTRGDTLVVNDPINGRVTIVAPNARIVRSVAVGRADLPWGGGCFDDGTFVLVTAAPSVGGDRYMQLTRRRLDGKTTQTLGPFWQSTPDRFLPSFSTVVAQGSKLYLSDPRVHEVRVYTAEGTLTHRIRSADPIEELTSTEKMALTPAVSPRGGNSAANRAWNADQDRLAPRPSRWPTSASIAVDPTGRLWVESFRKRRTEPHTYTGFDAAGKLLGRLILPADSPAIAFTAGGVMLWRTDKDGAEHLVVYELVAPR